MSTAARYTRFAITEARGHSPAYEAWCHGIAGDPDLLALIDTLPVAKRQPNLVLGAARFHGAEIMSFADFRTWFIPRWPDIHSTALARTTQTNEAGRCATLLPLLATLPQPLALIEVGASAGLCLYPDRYAYRYDARPVLGAPDAPLLACATSGQVPLPSALPRIAWRAGIDLNPLDVTDPDAMRWLEALIWPEQEARRARLRAAIAVARADPPCLVRGDLLTGLTDLVAQAPAVATKVVFHSAVLAYLSLPARGAFVRVVTSLRCRWISNEALEVFPDIRAHLPQPSEPDDGRFVLALDGTPLARSGQHGQSLHWFR